MKGYFDMVWILDILDVFFPQKRGETENICLRAVLEESLRDDRSRHLFLCCRFELGKSM